MNKKGDHIALFTRNGCLSKEAIRFYIDGALTKDQLQHIHEHISECNLCSGAIQGAQKKESSMSFDSGVQRIHDRYFSRNRAGRGYLKSKHVGISATVATLLLLLGVFGIFYMKDSIRDINNGTGQVNKVFFDVVCESTNNKIVIRSSNNTPALIDELKKILETGLSCEIFQYSDTVKISWTKGQFNLESVYPSNAKTQKATEVLIEKLQDECESLKGKDFELFLSKVN